MRWQLRPSNPNLARKVTETLSLPRFGQWVGRSSSGSGIMGAHRGGAGGVGVSGSSVGPGRVSHSCVSLDMVFRGLCAIFRGRRRNFLLIFCHFDQRVPCGVAGIATGTIARRQSRQERRCIFGRRRGDQATNPALGAELH